MGRERTRPGAVEAFSTVMWPDSRYRVSAGRATIPSVTSHAAGKSVEQEQELAVVFRCVWCGKTVELRSSDEAYELTDAQAFVAEHAECLRRIAQRTNSEPED